MYAYWQTYTQAHARTHTKDCLWLTLYLGYYHYYCCVFVGWLVGFVCFFFSDPLFYHCLLICPLLCWNDHLYLQVRRTAAGRCCSPVWWWTTASPRGCTLSPWKLNTWTHWPPLLEKRKRQWEDLGKIEINIYTAWEKMPKDHFLVETFDNGLPWQHVGALVVTWVSKVMKTHDFYSVLFWKQMRMAFQFNPHISFAIIISKFQSEIKSLNNVLISQCFPNCIYINCKCQSALWHSYN